MVSYLRYLNIQTIRYIGDHIRPMHYYHIGMYGNGPYIYCQRRHSKNIQHAQL